MSLVADYGSDSDSDGPVVAKTTVPPSIANATASIRAPTAPTTLSTKAPVKSSTQTRNTTSGGPPKKKQKRTLHLPPEIQKLLESGRALNSDDESDSETKKPAPVRKQPKTAAGADALLSFLPPPKVALAERQAPSVPSAADQVYDPNYVSNYSFDDEHAAEDYGRGKRGRNNDREMERLLQQGKFDAVAGKITEVKATAPDSWQPPIDGRGYAHDREAQVLASMAGTETEGGYVISSYKPTRLQRQRHQLTQLTFDAKLRELDLMDSKAQMVKSKRETQAKYGW